MKKISRLLAVFALACVMITSLACCSVRKIDASADLEKIRAAGVLKIGMECAYIPYNWTQFSESEGAVKIANTEGYADGFDVRIAKKIADALGVRLEVYAYEWEALVPAVESGALDGIIAGMSPTAGRREILDFTSNYYVADLCIVVRKDSRYADAKSLADLDGMVIACQDGSSHYKYFSQIKNADARYMKNYATLFTALEAGSIDGFSVEGDTAIAYANKDDSITYIALKNNDTGFEVSPDDVAVAVGLRKGSSLLGEINGILATISEEERSSIMVWANENAPDED